MRRPEFYRPGRENSGVPRVVIASGDVPEISVYPVRQTQPGSVTEKFMRRTDVFRYKTLITVLE
jgi:hypothetical protein